MSDKNKNILVVGSVGLDDVETQEGKVEFALGGSAVYFSFAASYFSKVFFVGVAGDDFPSERVEILKKENRAVDFTGFEIIKDGKTFRWGGKYHTNFNDRDTLFTDLNVFADFDPKIPADYKKNTDILFLANIHPELQLDVLNKLDEKKPELVILDTMNLWLDISKDKVIEVIKKTDILIINDSESELLTGENSFVNGAKKIFEINDKLKYAVIKLGKFGVYITDGKDKKFFVPAYPVDLVKDPTGAGDTFAGGFTGHLAKTGDYSFENMKKALVYGSVIASYTVSDFSVDAIYDLDWEKDIVVRYNSFVEMIKI